MNDFKESFRKQLQVKQEDLNKNNEIIRQLEELERIYNPDGENSNRRTAVLRSGENVFYHTMLIAGMLFNLRDKTKGLVDATVIGRVKSVDSTERKQNRKGRENKQNGDIIAYNIITDRVHNSEDFINVFRSNRIQGLYNERKSNLDIMSMAVEFIKSFEMYGISSELDESLPAREAREQSEKRLEGMKNACDKILENIKIYDKEDKVLSREFPIREYMQVMCEDLLQQEMKRAREGLYSEKARLEKEVRAEGKSKSTKAILKVQLKNLKAQINLLESKEDWTTKELIEIFTGIIDKERVELYIEILEHLKREEIEGMTNTTTKDKENSNEKIHCELLILILYQLTKLEFTKEGQYKGLIFNNVWMNLHNQLREFKNSEIDKGSYRNVTFESLQKLTTNLTRLNARLSDPLQYEILKYEMRYHLGTVVETFKERELPER